MFYYEDNKVWWRIT